MIFRPSREPNADDPFVAPKAILLVLGACLGIAGMVNNIDWLVLAAIAVIAAGIVLRVIGRRRKE